MNKNIQFRYVLKDAHFYCETCCDTITLKANKRGEIREVSLNELYKRYLKLKKDISKILD